MSLSRSCLKRLNLKEPILVAFLSSVGSEFQSLAPAIWKVFLPEEDAAIINHWEDCLFVDTQKYL